MRFPSLTFPEKYGYLIADSFFDFNNLRGIAAWCAIYETYGDGNIQHTPALPIRQELMADFLASFAKHCLEDEKLLAHVESFWPRPVENSLFQFALNIKYVEDKTRYYSWDEQKISSADSKRHDRRWHEIPGWANGSPRAALQLIFQKSPHSEIERYSAANQLSNYLRSLNQHVGYVEDWLDIKNVSPHLDWAFQAADQLVTSHRSRKRAIRGVEGYLQNIENDRAKTAT